MEGFFIEQADVTQLELWIDELPHKLGKQLAGFIAQCKMKHQNNMNQSNVTDATPSVNENLPTGLPEVKKKVK